MFPALIYRDSESNAVISLFSTGRLLCTGLNDLDEIADRIEEFEDLINSNGDATGDL